MVGGKIAQKTARCRPQQKGKSDTRKSSVEESNLTERKKQSRQSCMPLKQKPIYSGKEGDGWMNAIPLPSTPTVLVGTPAANEVRSLPARRGAVIAAW